MWWRGSGYPKKRWLQLWTAPDSDNNKYDEDFQTFASCTGGEKAAVTKFWAKSQHRLLWSFGHSLTSLATSFGRLGILWPHRLRHSPVNTGHHLGAVCYDPFQSPLYWVICFPNSFTLHILLLAPPWSKKLASFCILCKFIYSFYRFLYKFWKYLGYSPNPLSMSSEFWLNILPRDSRKFAQNSGKIFKGNLRRILAIYWTFCWRICFHEAILSLGC